MSSSKLDEGLNMLTDKNVKNEEWSKFCLKTKNENLKKFRNQRYR